MTRTSVYKVRINTHSSDTKALLLLADGAIVAILVELSEECHGRDQGKWAIETAFGIDDERVPANFTSASEAASWLSLRVAGAPFNLASQIPELC